MTVPLKQPQKQTQKQTLIHHQIIKHTFVKLLVVPKMERKHIPEYLQKQSIIVKLTIMN